MSEIYDRPIEIYAYSAKPMRTFHETSQSQVPPIRLSYFGGKHYDSIVHIDEEKQKETWEPFEPGHVEDKAISNEGRVKNEVRQARQEFDQAGKRDMEAQMAEAVALSEQQV